MISRRSLVLLLVMLLVVTMTTDACDGPSDRSAAPVRLEPMRRPDAGATGRDAGAASVDAAMPADPLATWIAGPLHGGCCTEGHGLGPASMTIEDGAVVLHVREDLPMRCVVEAGPRGPLSLRDCRLSSPWRVLSRKIPLACGTSGRYERCSGHYQLDNLEYADRGGDTIVVERPLRADELAPPPPPTDAMRTARAAAWLQGNVRIVYPGISSWPAHLRRDSDGSLQLRLDELSNLTSCTVEAGPDGDPAALVGCIPTSRAWRPAARRTVLHCRHPDDAPDRATCRGAMPWRDDTRVYDLPVALTLAPH